MRFYTTYKVVVKSVAELCHNLIVLQWNIKVVSNILIFINNNIMNSLMNNFVFHNF